MGNFTLSDLAPNLFEFVKMARKTNTVAAAMENQAWTWAIAGVPSVPAIAEFVDLWARTCKTHLSQGATDEVKWQLTASGLYSAQLAYQLFFLGRTEVPGMREL
jgi:hypothetical protein